MEEKSTQRYWSIAKLFPNIITLLALSIGMSSIRFALENKWEFAVCCVVMAAILDGIDGRLARMLNATSVFGAELDSLADFASFGIAPAIIIYIWSLHSFEYKLFSWGALLLYISCMAIRLARFNTTIISNKDSKNFFTGVPAPIGAMLALAPIMIDFEIANKFSINLKSYVITTILYVSIIGFMLASRIPTFSFKNLSVKAEFVWISLLSVSIFIIILSIYPWHVIPLMGLVYLSSIPFSIYFSKRWN